MGHVSYAGALAVALVGGITVIGLMTPSHSLKNPVETLASTEAPHSQDVVLQLQNASLPKLVAQPIQTPEMTLQPSAREPRYVIDARPVSYEPSSSFNF
jgi:hypothetical protein